MNKKQRIATLILGIVLGAAGFGCIAVAGVVQNHLGDFAANTFGVLGFSFLIASVIYLLRKLPRMMSSEMAEKAADMEAESNFFQRVQLQENAGSLTEKFIQAGFEQKDHYLYKRRFCFLKDYVNYYVLIENSTNVKDYINSFLERMDKLLETKKLFHKNNYIYLIFFQYEISHDDLDVLKNFIISQDVIQEIPRSISDEIVPIIYSIGSQEYIFRKNKKRHSLKPLHIATNEFCRVVLN